MKLTTICLSGQFKWFLLTLCYLTLLYFFIMDYRLYYRIRDCALRSRGTKDEPDYASSIPCDLDPLCTVTVKGLLLDYPNYYLLGPLAALFDRLVGLSDWSWISPNAISFSHVAVAVASAKCVSSKSLVQRRFGVLLFEVRSWMDDLDGLVARKRMHVDGERSEIGTAGYYVDGLCDALGTVALFVGVFHYIRWNLPKHGYEKLQPVQQTIEAKHPGACIVQRKKVRVRKVASSVILLLGGLLASSMAWNRYLYLYQDLLETNAARGNAPSLDELHGRQSEVFRFNSFWLVSSFWRLLNPHAVTDYLLFAVFVDRLWDYVVVVRWGLYGVLLGLVYFTELHYRQVSAFVSEGHAVGTMVHQRYIIATMVHGNRTAS